MDSGSSCDQDGEDKPLSYIAGEHAFRPHQRGFPMHTRTYAGQDGSRKTGGIEAT